MCDSHLYSTMGTYAHQATETREFLQVMSVGLPLHPSFPTVLCHEYRRQGRLTAFPVLSLMQIRP